MNNKLKIILPIVLVSSSVFVLFQIKNTSKSIFNQINNQPNNSTSNNNSTDELNFSIQFQKLNIISNRCRGCGKCVRLDPDHFEMQRNIAVVTSSQNLNSSNLKLAINNCPASAIILE